MQGVSSYIGNNAAAALLRTALLSGRGAHAHLLTGPAQIGKRTLAKLGAATLVCEAQPEQRPCGACRACGLVERDGHPDVRLTETLEGKRAVGIDQVRALEHDAALRPYEAERKALILTDADSMSTDAGNALLKTLEEPPLDTVLLLTAADTSQVLPTIASRCQEVALRPVPAEEIETALRARGAEPDGARLVSRLAGGRPGWALAALGDGKLLDERGDRVALLERALGLPRAERLALAGTFGESAVARGNALATLDAWQTWWRDALLVTEGCDDLVVNVDRLDALRRVGLDSRTCWYAVMRIQQAREQLDANANVRLAVEGLLLALPTGAVATIR